MKILSIEQKYFPTRKPRIIHKYYFAPRYLLPANFTEYILCWSFLEPLWCIPCEDKHITPWYIPDFLNIPLWNVHHKNKEIFSADLFFNTGLWKWKKRTRDVIGNLLHRSYSVLSIYWKITMSCRSFIVPANSKVLRVMNFIFLLKHIVFWLFILIMLDIQVTIDYVT